MTLKERARHYYTDLEKTCSVSILLGANDLYDLKLSEDEINLFAGFGSGMGCGSTCGALSGAIGVLSKLYGQREDFKEICGNFIPVFTDALGCGVIDCATLSAKYKTEETRCITAVEAAADALEKYIAGIDGKNIAPEEDTCTLTPADIKRVKGLGFLQHKKTNKFNGRIITRNGRITAAENQAISDAARLFGDGHIMFTSRLTVEVSGIDYNNIDAFREFLLKAGLETGGTGSKVRPVVSCKGTTCQYGLYDTYALSNEIHERFYKGYHDVSLPHKFKIAVGGCPNNCVKPSLNDLGIIGACLPGYDAETCKGCKKCQLEASCPVGAAKMVDGKLVIDSEKCNDCGRCIGKCPFHCNDACTYGWHVYVGGRWGKRYSIGKRIDKVFTDKTELLNFVDKVILFYRSEGKSGERLADTIERIGFENAQKMLLSDELLQRKTEILGKDVVGGATC